MYRYLRKMENLIDNGRISNEIVVSQLLGYLSEDDLKKFMLKAFGGRLLTDEEIKKLEED